ncbi:MAG TPA: adenylosuccinate lyase [Gammaproteobacteria bacterium]|nr:adenylosuccinate lyase [Gammaproteobacteria bacterium]
MSPDPLMALSPLDGRYAGHVQPLAAIFSEHGLIRQRALVEIRWLEHLADEAAVEELHDALHPALRRRLHAVIDDFSLDDSRRVKQIEAATNHDVKAVEYFIRERLEADSEAGRLIEFVHFGCTSEDINNLAYALMIDRARRTVLAPAMRELVADIDALAKRHAELPMLSRTHGQPATPTTLGKELANFAARLLRQCDQFEAVAARGKMNGAVGNFNAHFAAYPELDWAAIAESFVQSLGLEHSPLTTQIEPHDWIAEYCDALNRFGIVLLDFCRDLWGYIALGYFRQQPAREEVGSSTMPHKINPIDFENAEGNLGLAHSLLAHFSAKLPISRWQRDLSDSTVLRSVGTALAHVLLAISSCRRGLARLEVDEARLRSDLDQSWEVLAEAVQTVMRRFGVEQPYEKLKALTRGTQVDPEMLRAFIAALDIPAPARERLLALTPATYLGNAADQARAKL